MKPAIIKISGLLLLLFIIGCEDVGVVETKLEFKEKTVIRSELIAYSEFTGVSFTRTLPVDSDYDIKKAEIKNVDSYIRINGIQIVPLHYINDGLYKPKYSLQIYPGYTYELFGTLDNKSFYSKTLVPNTPSVNNVSRETDYLIVSVKPFSDEVYGAAWVIYSSVSDQEINSSPIFQEIISPLEDNPTRSISIRTSSIPDRYLIDPYRDNTYVQIYSFDKAYSRYFKSKDNNQLINNAFIQGGDPIAWNISGEDVIGLFIGRTNGRRIKVN